MVLSTLTVKLLSLKLEASEDLTTTSLTLVLAVRFPDKGFGFHPSPSPRLRVALGNMLAPLLSPWSVDCDRVPRLPSSLGALVGEVSWA